MDDFGNVVYVIGVVGYLIFRVFAGKKKQQPKRSSNSDTTTTVEDIIRQLTHEKEPEIVAKPVLNTQPDEHRGHVHNAKQFLDIDSPKHKTTNYQMSAGEMASHTRASKKVEKAKIDTVNHVDNVFDEVSEGLDIRKAIIYQTILEAPYLRHI